MKLITWIFYVLRKVIIVPMGSVNDMQATEEDAIAWYKTLDNEDNKLHKIKKNVFEFWGFKLGLLVISIWLIPKLKDVYNGKTIDEDDSPEMLFKQKD